jgi:hypothetical protein
MGHSLPPRFVLCLEGVVSSNGGDCNSGDRCAWDSA